MKYDLSIQAVACVGLTGERIVDDDDLTQRLFETAAHNGFGQTVGERSGKADVLAT